MRLFRSRSAYILLLLAAVLYAVVAESSFSELLVYGFFLLPVCTFLYTLLTLPTVRVTVIPGWTSPRKGDVMAMEVTVTNRSFLPIPYLLLYCTVDRAVSYDPADEFQTLQISLQPHETRRLELDILCRRHGYFTAGITSLAVLDYLRIFRLWRPIRPFKLLVYPTVQIGEGLLLEGLPSPYGSYASHTASFEYTRETRDVRPFEPGDRLSHLHAPLSSRGLGLFTRTLDYETAGHLTLLYDPDISLSEDTDLAAHLAAALIHDAARRGQDVTLLLGGEADEPPSEKRYSPAHSQEAFEAIVRSVKSRRRFPSRWLETALPPVSGRLILISCSPSVSMLSYAARTKEKGFNPVLLYTHDQPVDAALQALRVEHYHAGPDPSDPVWRLV